MLPPELFCPECRRRLSPEAGPRCVEHGLYGLDADTLASLGDHPLLGQLLDEKYALIGVLGRGGSGSVYRGLQEPLGRPVGVKLLHSSFLGVRDGRERFEREARALASLTSPHTVRLLDYGITRQGPVSLRNIAYLVMELLEGEDLQTRIERGPLEPVEVLALLDALADSLDEAHAAGIVHRDLKPSNIVMTRRRDGREVPKLIDFGIARIVGTTHTEQGRVSGTPLYMAPEQARGDLAQGGAADVYGVGALCYELLTGHLPFTGPSATAVMLAQCQDVVPPLDGWGDGRAGRDLLTRLDPVIRGSLSKDPAARPASVGALRDAFARALEGAGAKTAVMFSRPAALEPTGADDTQTGAGESQTGVDDTQTGADDRVISDPDAAAVADAFARVGAQTAVAESDAFAQVGARAAVAESDAGAPDALVPDALVPDALEPDENRRPPPSRVGLYILGVSLALGLATAVAVSTHRDDGPTVASGTAVPGGLTPVPPATSPATVTATASVAPASPASAPIPSDPEATRPSGEAAPARPRSPLKPAPAPAGSARLTLREDGRQRVIVPAGRWRVTGTVEGEGDPLVFAWEAGACRGRGKPGTKHYDELCTFVGDAALVVYNPITLFGDTTRVGIVWAAPRK